MFRKRHDTLALSTVCLLLTAGVTRATGAPLPTEWQARGGLCVMLAGAEAWVTDAQALLEAGPWIIHGLDSRPEAVDRARQGLLEQRIHGRVSVEHWPHGHLPYADNLVNRIVVRNGAPAIAREELLRALAPGGMAVMETGGEPEILRKSRPEEMGEWTHPWQGPDGSLASPDRATELPNAFQWIAGPTFPLRGRKDSAGVLLSAGGRLFSITGNVPQNIGARGQDHLVARDAFNGTLLWSHPWTGPTRAHWGGVHEAVVASAERVYGVGRDAIIVLDAATGSVLATWPMSSTPEKLLLHYDRLLVPLEDGLTALDVHTGAVAWRHPVERPWGILASDGRVFFLDSTRKDDGVWRHALRALDLVDGTAAWQQPVESLHDGPRENAVLRLHFAGGGALCLIERRELRFLSVEDGCQLWRHESQTEARYGGVMDTRQVGHFFANGWVWVRETRAPGGQAATAREATENWTARAPLTGEVLRTVEVTGPQGLINYGPGGYGKVSCQPLTATSRYVFDARLATLWDFETGVRQGFNFARGGCQVGMVPANGMAYTTPNACGCLAEQLRGSLAVVHTGEPGLHTEEPGPLETGPAYGQIAAAPTGDPSAESEWPMYRRDSRRSAHLPQPLPTPLRTRWEVKLDPRGDDRDGEWRLLCGRPFTPPVVAGELVVLGEPQTHQVIALERSTGAERWRFTAGGRISVPPSLHQGLALFGAHDGYVYALRATDGTLAWRRRAAPSDRRILAYGQLESAWPVAGGVLVYRDLVLAAAGRVPDADGGLLVHAFEPHTGERRWSRRITEARYGVCDPLVTDDRQVYLLDKALDPLTGAVMDLEFAYRFRNSLEEPASIRYPKGIHYLRGGKTGLLETSWTEVNNALRRGQSQRNWGTSEGDVLAYADGRVYAFVVHHDERWPYAKTKNDRSGGLLEVRGVESAVADWSLEWPGPSQIETILVADQMLFVAGPRNSREPESPGFVRALSRQDGRELFDLDLPAAPVPDGLAAAAGEMILVLRDGRVLSLEASGEARVPSVTAFDTSRQPH